MTGYYTSKMQDEIRVIDVKDLGHPSFICPEGDMSRISDTLLDCAVYLYPSEQAARDGERAGGSGFVVGVQSDRTEDFYSLYIITNSHVVREARSTVVRVNTVKGGMEIYKSDISDWHHHPYGDDIAVMPVAIHGNIIKIAYVKSSFFVTKETIRDYDIGVGDDVFMVGRFITHEGKQKNLPSARFGNISMMPVEPLRHMRGINQESFVVEMRSIGGYSGSPVFVSIDRSIGRPNSEKSKGIEIGHPPDVWLLGVDWGHIQESYRVLDEGGARHPDNLMVITNTNMAGVVPAWKVQELLNEEVLVNLRKNNENKVLEQRATKPKVDIALDAVEKNEGDVLTRDDFFNALGKVTRPLSKQPDQGNSETSV
jgi:hypothetical protein